MKYIKIIKTYLLSLSALASSISPLIAQSFCADDRLRIQPPIQESIYENVNYEWLSNTMLPTNYSYFDDDIELNPFITQLKANINANKNSPMGSAVTMYSSIYDYNSRNTIGLTPIQQYLNKIDAIQSIDDFATICSELTKNGFNILNIEYLYNGNAPTIKIVDFYLDFYTPAKYTSKYLEYLKNIFSYIDSQNASSVADSVFGLEQVLAKHSDENHHNEIKGRDYQTLMAESKTNNFAETFSSTFLKNMGASSKINILLTEDFICQLQIIRKLDVQSLKNLLKSSILRQSAPLLIKDLENLWSSHKNYSALKIDEMYTKILQSSAGFCRLYGKALVDNISSEDKRFSTNLFNRVKEQFKTNLRSLGLTDTNKIEKYINDIKISYGIPIDLNCGISFPILSSKSPLENMLTLNTFNTSVCLSKLNNNNIFNSTKEKTYLLANVDPNMAYDSSSHSVVFCPLIFHSSRYNNSLSNSEKWLALAFTIGHEIGHSIDSKNVKNLSRSIGLSNNDIAILSQNFQSISNQISSYTIDIKGQLYSMNPTRVLFEAVADIYGAEVVVKIIKSDNNATLDEFFKVYSKMRRSIESDEKLKAIIEREFHPINKYRVDKTLSNLEELYQTYNIGINNKMYIPPENRASLNK